jgi:hypothetical protein
LDALHYGPGQISGGDAMITVRKIIRSLTAAMPAWLIAICGLCLFFPLARLAALLFTAAMPDPAGQSPPRGERLEGWQVAPRFQRIR